MQEHEEKEIKKMGAHNKISWYFWLIPIFIFSFFFYLVTGCSIWRPPFFFFLLIENYPGYGNPSNDWTTVLLNLVVTRIFTRQFNLTCDEKLNGFSVFFIFFILTQAYFHFGVSNLIKISILYCMNYALWYIPVFDSGYIY